MEEYQASRVVCEHIGVSGLSTPWIRPIIDGYEARVGVALLGMVQDPNNEIDNPFDPEYPENFCKGIGMTEEAALRALKADMLSMSQSLFDG